MMAERTLVRVDDVVCSSSPSRQESSTAAFEDLPDYVCLVFCYDTIEYKPNGQMRKLSDTLKKHAQVVEFQKPLGAGASALGLRGTSGRRES